MCIFITLFFSEQLADDVFFKNGSLLSDDTHWRRGTTVIDGQQDLPPIYSNNNTMEIYFQSDSRRRSYANEKGFTATFSAVEKRKYKLILLYFKMHLI